MFTTMPARAGEIIRPTGLHALGMVGRPVAEVHSDPVSFVRLAAGLPGHQPVTAGDGGTAAELLASRVVSCPPLRRASPA